MTIVELSHGVYNFKDVWGYFKRCGWRATPAGPLSYDHFYIQPGKTKRDVKGVDYFDGEAELVAYGKALKIFGDVDEPVDPPRSATLSPVLPPKPRRRRSNSNSSSVASVTPTSHYMQQHSAQRRAKRRSTARRQLPNPSDVISISSNTSEGEENEPSFTKTSTAESETSSSSSSEEEFMPTFRREEDPDASPPRLKTKKRRQISDTSDSSPAKPIAPPASKKRATSNGILGKQTAKMREVKPHGLLFQTNGKMAMGESPPARRKPTTTGPTSSQSSGRSQPPAEPSASASGAVPSLSKATPQHIKVSTFPVAQRPPAAPVVVAQDAPAQSQSNPPATTQPPDMDVRMDESTTAPPVVSTGDADIDSDSGAKEMTYENGVDDTSYGNGVTDTNYDEVEEIAGAQTHLDLKKVSFPSSPTQIYRIRITSTTDDASSSTQTTIWMENLQSREQRECVFGDIRALDGTPNHDIPADAVFQALLRCLRVLEVQPQVVDVTGQDHDGPKLEPGVVELLFLDDDVLCLELVFPCYEFWKQSHRFTMSVFANRELQLERELASAKENLEAARAELKSVNVKLEETTQAFINLSTVMKTKHEYHERQQKKIEQLQLALAKARQALEKLKQEQEKQRVQQFPVVAKPPEPPVAANPSNSTLDCPVFCAESDVLTYTRVTSGLALPWNTTMKPPNGFAAFLKAGEHHTLTIQTHGTYQFNLHVTHESMTRLVVVITKQQTGTSLVSHRRLDPTLVLLSNDKKRISRVDQIIELQAFDTIFVQLVTADSMHMPAKVHWSEQLNEQPNRFLLTLLDTPWIYK